MNNPISVRGQYTNNSSLLDDTAPEEIKMNENPKINA